MAKRIKFINLTPYPIVVQKIHGGTRTFNPSGKVAHIEKDRAIKVNWCIWDMTLYATKYGEIIDLPEPKDNIYYFVPKEVAVRCCDRLDIFMPGPALTNDRGEIIKYEGIQTPRCITK